MIDPNIILQSQTPLEEQRQVQSLNNMKLEGNEIEASTEGRKLSNQQIARVLSDKEALDSALSQNTRPGPDGQMATDYDGVIKSLTASGKGEMAQKVQSSMVEMQRAHDSLAAERAGHVASMAGSILNSDMDVRPAVYQHALQVAVQQGYMKPGQLPAQWSPQVDAILAQTRDSALTAQEQYQQKWNQDKAIASADRVGAAEDRAKAAQLAAQAAMERATNDKWEKTDMVSPDGHPISMNAKTGEYRTEKTVSVDMTDARKGRTVTPDASLAAKRANQNDYEKNAKAELDNRTMRDTIDAALKNGKVYVDSKGTIRPFSSMKNAEGDALSPDDIAALKAEMQNRRSVAQQAVLQAVANKNDAMQRNGVQPQVSTAQATAAYNGQPATTKSVTPLAAQQITTFTKNYALKKFGGDTRKATAAIQAYANQFYGGNVAAAIAAQQK